MSHCESQSPVVSQGTKAGRDYVHFSVARERLAEQGIRLSKVQLDCFIKASKVSTLRIPGVRAQVEWHALNEAAARLTQPDETSA